MSIKLKMRDQLAMYRCAMYTAMGVTNAEAKPTDRQCIEWLQLVLAQAAHVTDPPITLEARTPVLVKTEFCVPQIEIRQWDLKIELPDWRKLPA